MSDADKNYRGELSLFLGAAEGMFFSAGMLFDIARSAHDRAKELDPDDRRIEIEHGPVITAIVFSAVAIEAFINEAIELACRPLSGQDSKSAVFGAILEEAEESRASTRAKYMLARVLSKGDTFDKGSRPFQDFLTLFRLRDEFVHPKPKDRIGQNADGEFKVKHPRIVEDLRSKNILAVETRKQFVASPSWVALLSTRAVARWACTTAIEMVQATLPLLPGDVGGDMQVIYSGKHFVPLT